MATPERGPWRAGGSLEVAEKLMLECAASGETLNGVDDPSLPDPGADQLKAAPRTVRAAVLRHLLTETNWAVHPKGVRLRRVRISGLLDLEAAAVRCPLWLEDCDLDDPRPIVLDYATAPLLVLHRCRIAGLSGDNLAVAANLDLRGSVFAGSVILSGARIGGSVRGTGSVFGGLVVLSGARIGGSITWHGAQLGADEDGNSLICYGTSVRLSVHLNRGFTADGAILLSRADIGGELLCQNAHLGANKFRNSLGAPGLRVGGAAYLDGGFSAQGTVWLTGASIGGQLKCASARLGSDPEGNSLLCDGIRTGGSVSLDVTDGAAFTADGAVQLAGAEITGSLSCRGAELGANQDSNSLVADEMKVSVAVLLDHGFTASGAVRLAGADIAGQLRCRESQITGTDQDGNSLVGIGIKVGGPAYLDGGFIAAGAIELSGADISGLISLAAAQLGANKKRYALLGDGMRAGRDVIGDGGAFGGGIRLAGAEIGGSFLCRGTRLGAGWEQNSLVAVRLKVGGDVLLDRLISAGTVIVAGADIGGRFCCRGAKLNGSDADGDALSANGAKVGGSVLLNNECTTAGAVQLSHASIGGSLHCGGARLVANKDGNALLAQQINVIGGVLLDEGFATAGTVSLRGASIGRELRWELGGPAGGEVNLEGARAYRLTDNWTGPRALGYWPAGRLRLAGFTYAGFGGDHPATVNRRLDWIRSQYATHHENSQNGNRAAASSGSSGHARTSSAENAQPPALLATPSLFATQPYKQLADVYRRAGQEDEARAVEIAMRRDLRKYGNLPRLARSLNWLLDVTIRYGFQTGRALAGIVTLYLIVFLAFLFAQHQGDLIAASNVQNASLHPAALHCVTGYPCFYPAGYAFDLVVPLINIRQADFWQANGHHWLGWAWVLGTWMATALGWFLATLLVVGYSGLARQE